MFEKFKESSKLVLVAVLFILQATLSACGSSSSSDDSDPLVSTDGSKVYVSQSGAVTVSGVVVDAVKRTLISGVSVTIRVDGNNYTVTSAPASHASPGSFAFLLTPAESEYFLTITDGTSTYAPYFYANTTPEISNNSGGIGTQDIGSAELYDAINTSISVKNISGGTAISGLTLYYDTKDIAEANSSETVSISGVDIVATETAGVYSFPLPNNGVDYNIKIKELVDSADVVYDPYNATITDNVLTSLQANNDKSYYMKADDPQQFTIFLHLVDDEGHAFDAGDVLVLNAAGSTVAVYAERKTDTTNEYVLTTTAASFDFTVLNIDMDNDGVNDTAAIQLTTLDETTNILDSGSFNSSREATVVVPITMITADQNIAAELLSTPDQFQVNGLAEVIFAFDRPVEIVHEMRMRSYALNSITSKKSVASPANIFQQDGITAATLTGDSAATVSLDGADSSIYSYQNDANSAAVTTSLSDTNGEVTSPYEVEYDSAQTISVVAASAYVFSASNTLLTITLDSSTIAANQEYTFEFAVKGTLSDTPVAYISQTLLAKSNATISALTDLWLDDFNYMDTPTRDLLNALTEADLTNQTDHANLLTNLSGATYDGTNAPLVEYLIYGLVSSTVFDSLPAPTGVYLVSKAKLSGTVEVVSQTETYVDSGAVTTATFSTLGEYYGLDYSSNSGIVTGDLDLSNLTNIASDAKYLLAVPSNHGIDESGMKTVYGTVLEDTANETAGTTTVVSSGADITTEGVYYVYDIPVTLINAGGYISTVVLDFNISVNGTNFTGSQSYLVQ